MSESVELQTLVAWCNERLNLAQIADFPGAENGLQVANQGKVTRIGAAVDAGLKPFQIAAERGINFLIVHHGLFWESPIPITGIRYERVRQLLEANCALYSAHLPLDAHPELGNNALLAKALGITPTGTFGDYQGVPIGVRSTWSGSNKDLQSALGKLFPRVLPVLPNHTNDPGQIGILTGSGSSCVSALPELGIDTLITGELKQNCFNLLQEANIQAFTCGHYETETFGVKALAQEISDTFGLPWEFIDTGCTL